MLKAILSLLTLLTVGTAFGQPVPVSAKTTKPEVKMTGKKLPDGRTVWFIHRDAMKRVVRNQAKLPKGFRAVALPLDNTGGQKVNAPILGNDQYGDCGPVMASHADSIYTFGQGKPGFSQANVTDMNAFLKQYFAVSGGDNGVDESMMVGQGGIWTTGIAGQTGGWPATAPNAAPVVLDTLDIDITNIPLAQAILANVYTIQLAWSVPDDFLTNFQSGGKWLNADIPNPANGHYTPLADIDADGNMTLWTWGGYVWVSNSFVGSVQPQCFAAFNIRQFNPATGYDSHGNHISTVGAFWVSIGGNAQIVAKAVAQFPAANPTPPGPPQPQPVGQQTITITGADGKVRTIVCDATDVIAVNGQQPAVNPVPVGIKSPSGDVMALPAGWSVTYASGKESMPMLGTDTIKAVMKLIADIKAKTGWVTYIGDVLAIAATLSTPLQSPGIADLKPAEPLPVPKPMPVPADKKTQIPRIREEPWGLAIQSKF